MLATLTFYLSWKAFADMLNGICLPPWLGLRACNHLLAVTWTDVLHLFLLLMFFHPPPYNLGMNVYGEMRLSAWFGISSFVPLH